MSNEQLQKTFLTLKQAYQDHPAPDYAQRVKVLKQLKQALIANEQNFYEALSQDYGYRSEFDTLLADILPSVAAINYALKNLKKWMKPSKRHAGLVLVPSSVEVHYQPLGIVGIITPWNFPLFLAIGPTVQALAAGNRVMIKMSEFTPHVNRVLRQTLSELSDFIEVVEGDAQIGAAFSRLAFDHILFTGSSAVGKYVYQAAAENLTPVTLELGGKSPTIIDNDIDMNVAVDAIIWGKAINSGQICIAPDYIFVAKPREQEFIDTFIKRYREYFLQQSSAYKLTYISSERQYLRLISLLEDAKKQGAKVHAVQELALEKNHRVYPQLITNWSEDMSIASEEIFGSLLPIKTYESVDEVIDYVNARPRPLALYIMSKNKSLIDKLLKQTHSGGVAINDTVMHAAADDAPFGGIGNSGIGHYHGVEGFLTFSKAKTVLRSPTWLPKNRLLLKNRDLAFKLLRKLFLR